MLARLLGTLHDVEEALAALDAQQCEDASGRARAELRQRLSARLVDAGVGDPEVHIVGLEADVVDGALDARPCVVVALDTLEVVADSRAGRHPDLAAAATAALSHHDVRDAAVAHTTAAAAHRLADTIHDALHDVGDQVLHLRHVRAQQRGDRATADLIDRFRDDFDGSLLEVARVTDELAGTDPTDDTPTGPAPHA